MTGQSAYDLMGRTAGVCVILALRKATGEVYALVGSNRKTLSEQGRGQGKERKEKKRVRGGFDLR